MGQKFNITAQLNLVEPRNLRSVSNKLHKVLQGQTGSIDLKFNPKLERQVDILNKRLSVTRTHLHAIRQDSLVAASSLSRMANAISNASNRTRQVTVVTTGFNQQLTNLNRNAKIGSSQMEKFGAQAALASRRFLAFAAPVGVVLGLVAAIKDGTKAALEYQHVNVRIAQVSGKTTNELRGLNGQIGTLAKDLGVASHGLQDVSQTLIQAGLSAKDTRIALDSLAKTELAPTFDNLRDTTEGAIAIFGQFGTEAKDLEKQLGAINTVSARYAVESADLITAIRKSGGAFRQAGGSLNELLGLFTSVRATTRESADSIATAFRTIFARLQRPDTIRKLESLLNIKLSDNGNFVGPLKAIQQLNAALANTPDGSLLKAAVAEEVGGIRQIGKTIPLINQYAKAIEAIGVAEEGEASLQRDVITGQESMIRQITKLKERFLDLFRTISNSSTFQNFLNVLLGISNALLGVSERLVPLLPAFAALAAVKSVGSVARFTGGFFNEATGRTNLRRFSSGGLVPGTGSGDKVHALLEPQEFVVRKAAVRKIGLSRLMEANGGNNGRMVGGVAHFDKGGLVPDEYAGGSLGSATPLHEVYKLQSSSKQTAQAAKSFTQSLLQPFKDLSEAAERAAQATYSLAVGSKIAAKSVPLVGGGNVTGSKGITNPATIAREAAKAVMQHGGTAANQSDLADAINVAYTGRKRRSRGAPLPNAILPTITGRGASESLALNTNDLSAIPLAAAVAASNSYALAPAQSNAKTRSGLVAQVKRMSGTIPLKRRRLSFDESAAEVAAGGQGTFKQGTYGLGAVQGNRGGYVIDPASGYAFPVTGTQTPAKIGRGNSVADRLANIQSRGRNGLLSAVRRGQLARQQQAYFESIGFQEPDRSLFPTIRGLGTSIAARFGRGTALPPNVDDLYSNVAARRAGLTRQQRIARIRSMGRGGLLSSVRSSQSNVYKAGRFLKGNLGRVGFGLGALAFSGAGENFADFVGRIGTSSSTEADYRGGRNRAVAGGAVSGALAGGTLGSFFGPVGIAVGGLAGGIVGAVQGLKQFKNELMDTKIAKGFDELSKSTTELSQALLNSGGQFSADVENKARASFATQKSQLALIEEERSGKRSSGLFRTYGDLGKVDQEALRKQVDVLSSGDASLQQLLTAGLQQPNRNGRFSDTEIGKQIISTRANLRASRRALAAGDKIGSSVPEDVIDQFRREETEAFKKSVDALDAELGAREQNNRAIESNTRFMEEQLNGLRKFSQRIEDFNTNSQGAAHQRDILLNAGGGGQVGLRRTRLSSNLANFGTAGFNESIEELSRRAPSAFGKGDKQDIIATNKAFQAIQDILPSLQHDQNLNSEGGFERLENRIADALAKGGVSQRESIFGEIMTTLKQFQNDPAEAEEVFGTADNNKLTEKIHDLSDALFKGRDNIREALQGIAEGIDDQGNQLVEGLGRYYSLQSQIRESQGQADQIKQAGIRFVGERRVRQFGGDFTSHVGPRAANAAFFNEQQRLVGGRGLDPQAILNQALEARRGQQAAAADIEKNGADGTNSTRFRAFEDQVNKSVQALRNLADATNRNAALQERLNALDKDADSRLGLAERFFSADSQGRAELEAEAQAAIKAVQAGTLDVLTNQEQQRATSFLNSTRDVRLFGGEKTGGDFFKELAGNSAGGVFNQTSGDRAEVKSLENEITNNLKTAVDAQNSLTQFLQTNQADFFANLSQNQQEFLQSLGNVMNGEKANFEFAPKAMNAPQLAAAPQNRAAPVVQAEEAAPAEASPMGRKERNSRLRQINSLLGKQFGTSQYSTLSSANFDKYLEGQETNPTKIAQLEAERSDLLHANASESVSRKELPGASNLRDARRRRQDMLRSGTEARRLQNQIGRGLLKGSRLDQAKERLSDLQDKARGLTDDQIKQKRANARGVEGVGGAPGVEGPNFQEFSNAANSLTGPLNAFSQQATELSKSFAAIPHSIELRGTHEVNVNINGADLLAKLDPNVRELVTQVATAKVQESLRKNFPEIGVVNG